VTVISTHAPSLLSNFSEGKTCYFHSRALVPKKMVSYYLRKIIVISVLLERIYLL
jgi:hypothetical protein